MTETAPLTDLLSAWSGGDQQALEELTPLVYNELYRLAHHYLLRESSSKLQTTELVNEAFLRLAGNDVSWTDRAHFYVVAARTMRYVPVTKKPYGFSSGSLEPKLTGAHRALKAEGVGILAWVVARNDHRSLEGTHQSAVQAHPG